MTDEPGPRKDRKQSRKSENTHNLDQYQQIIKALGFSPIEVIDEIVNTVLNLACDEVDSLEERLCNDLPEKYHKSIQDVSYNKYMVTSK